MVSAGYVHEGIRLVESLRLRYKDKDYFKRLTELAFDDKYKLERRVMKEIRDSVAFHLDQDDRSTKAVLERLKLPRYDLVSGNSEKGLDFYCDMADTIDLNHIIQAFRGDKTEEETKNIVLPLISRFVTTFFMEGHRFVAGIAEEMEIHQHTE